MSDKNFKVKSGLNIPITSAAILTTDSSGNISSTAILPITAGGTGQSSATNAINALLPVQNGSTVNYSIQSDGTNISWAKIYNQLIKDSGVSVTPRRNLNFVGATFTDSSETDTTTITAGGVSTDGGSTITASSASVKPLIIKGAASQTANLQEWQDSTGALVAAMWSSGTFSTAGRVSIGNGSSGAKLDVLIASSTQLGLVVKGVISQTANLQEWQNSAGTILARVNQNGAIVSSSVGIFGAQTAIADTELSVYSTVATQKGIVIKGAASQTADLQQWQNSAGTVLANVDASGNIYTSSTTIWAGYNRAADGSALYNFTTVAGATYAQAAITRSSGFNGNLTISQQGTGAVVVQNGSAAAIGLIVKGTASQTANLQEWKDSAGTILSKVDSSGIIYSSTAASGTNTTQVATTQFVSTAVNNLINSAPGTLDTLSEIAAALSNDPNFYSTISTLTTALSSQDTYSLMGAF